MKVAFFMGFLVCLNLAFTDAAINNERIQLLQRLLQRFDPFTIRDVSLVLSDDISVSLKSAVIANLSNFDLPQDDEVGNNINATIFIPSVSYNVDRLSISSKKLGIQYALPSLRAVVGGVSLAVSHSFSHNPLKMETFLILAQISDLSVQSSVRRNGSLVNVNVGKERVQAVNALALKYEKVISKLILDVFNDVLEIVRL